MPFTDRFIRRPILSIVLSLLILLIGASAVFMLPVRQYPFMQSATIVIDVNYPGATQAVMQGFVTTPISQAVATASGIEYLTAVSAQGRSEIKAKLVLNADSNRSMTEILAKVQQVKYLLPPGANDPIVSKITDGTTAVQYVGFASDTLSTSQLAEFASRFAQPLIASVPGVAAADLKAGQMMAMRIWVDPMKLASRGLSAADVSAALRANNVQAAPGQLKGADTAINITASTDVNGVEGFRQMVIKRQGSAVVTMGDVATVELGAQSYDSLQLSNGHRSVTIAISPTPDGNPLEIVKNVKALLPQIQRAAPPGLTVASKYDIAFFVNASIDEVIRTLVEAIAIVIVVIFLFLGSVRAVIIPVVTIPLSLIGTAALMLAGGFSLNLLTLLAMVLATGLVVDDAIVVVENIHRHIEEGLSPVRAALIGAREILSPVIAMTLTLAAVYTPIGLMGGLTGALFREFAFTLAGSVVVSGVVALTLSPMMSSWLLNDRVNEGRLARSIEHGIAKLTAGYTRLLDVTLAARPAVLLVGAGVLAAIIVLFTGAQRELSPPEDTGTIYVQTKAPQYSNVDYGVRAAYEVQGLMDSIPEFVGSWFSTGGDAAGSGSGGINLSRWEQRKRSGADIQTEINSRGAAFTDVRVSAYQGAALPAASSGLPVQMVIRSPEDFPTLYASMERIKAAARSSGLFAYVDSDLAFDSPEARLTIDRGKAGQLGVSMDEIASTLAILVGENYVTRFNWHDRSYDVITQVPRNARGSPDELGLFYVKSNTGALLPLSSVVQIGVRPQANQLPQFNQMNSATLAAILAPGVTMGRAVQFLQSQPLAPGATLDWLGESRQYVTEGDRLTISFIYALVVIFLVLAAQFESFRDPLVILVTVPLAVCGALIPLYLQYSTLNIYTQIGLVTLIGLISKHGILMVSFANHLQHEQGLDRIAAIRRAAQVRMRPVLMTTAAMVAGLIPLIFASGAGASSRFAIGIVVATGMLVGTLFTLFVLPTMYSFIARDHRAATESPRQRELASIDALAPAAVPPGTPAATH